MKIIKKENGWDIITESDEEALVSTHLLEILDSLFDPQRFKQIIMRLKSKKDQSDLEKLARILCGTNNYEESTTSG